jgi:tetratricopeptide (TPR) repeat protein
MIMLPLLATATMAATAPPAATPAATPAPAPSTEQLRFERCAALAETSPAAAIDEAGTWRLRGGGALARQCEGLAFVTQKRWEPAVIAFEAAARLADRAADGRAATLWVQAGNAALAGGNAEKARAMLDSAIARATLSGEALGEAHLDRARARAALGDLKGARGDLDQTAKLVPADPLGWLLSATLARKMNDLPRARADIAEAARRAPDDPSVALEAGNIAVLSGNDAAARIAWAAAVKLQPDGPVGKAAADSLARLAR